MRTAREVIAESRYERAKREMPSWEWDEQLDDIAEWVKDADADIAALRAEGLVIVAEADVEDAMGAATGFLDDHDMEFPDWWKRIATMLDAALAAGGTDGH